MKLGTEEAAMLQITVADPETRSGDLVAENIAQLKALFPDAFTEGKVDFDVPAAAFGRRR